MKEGTRLMPTSTMFVDSFNGNQHQKSNIIFFGWKSCSSQRMLMRSIAIRDLVAIDIERLKTIKPPDRPEA